MESRRLDDLAPTFRLKVFALLARFTEAGIPVLIVNTLRDPTQQAINIAKGVSWTQNSKHLGQPPSYLATAIDIAPYDIYLLHGSDKIMWDANDPVWLKMGLIGESLGLIWGGRWKDSKGNPRPDLGHFEEKVVKIV